MPDIAAMCGVTAPCVRDWMDRHGIERRDTVGEYNPMWKGGANDYYGPTWHPARREACERDNWKCRRCGLTNEEHLSKFNQELHVHHIRPFRTFDNHEEANEVSNLITLCRECHIKLEGLPIDQNSD